MKPVFEWVYTPRSVPRSSGADTAPVRDASTISGRIEQAFDAASTSTGTSFDYLVKTAQRESAMNPTAKARTSTATGLFQFIESTWLETMKLSGPDLGLGHVADRIEVVNGRYRVPDPADRAEILALREDPEIASLMAGALTRRNAAYLESRIGRAPNAGELYIAHFMGAGGAAALIELAGTSPNASAAAHFPRHASANRSIFYEKGEALTVEAVYADLVSKHGGTGIAVDPSAAVIAAYATPEGKAGAGDPFAVASDANANRVDAGWRAAAATDAFSGLFRSDGPAVVTAAAAAPSPSFWQGYTVAPALFDVAVAEDMKAISASELDEKRKTASIAAIVEDAEAGPLDLSRFLDTGEG